MGQAIIEALINDEGAALVGEAELAACLTRAANAITVLFFTGDPEKKAETADVAVVLRELYRKNRAALALAIVKRADEAALMKAYGVTTLPSLVFFAGGRPIETIARIQNWSVYEEKLPGIIARARACLGGAGVSGQEEIRA